MERTEVVLRLVEAMLGNPRYNHHLESEIVKRAQEMADQILAQPEPEDPDASASPDLPEHIRTDIDRLAQAVKAMQEELEFRVTKAFSGINRQLIR